MAQSDEKDKISESYREKMDKLLNDKFNHEFFPVLNRHEIDRIWEEINTEMDIGEIWHDISSDLERIMPSGSGTGTIMRLIAAILIVLFSLIAVKNGKPDSLMIDPDIMVNKIHNEQSAELIIRNNSEDLKSGANMKEITSQSIISHSDKSEEGNKIEYPASVMSNQPIMPQITGNNELVSVVKTETVTEPANQNISHEYFSTEAFEIKQALILYDLGKSGLFTETYYGIRQMQNNPNSQQSSGQLIDRDRISAGLITSFKNTWLLNQETFEGFASDSYTTTEFVFMPDAGVSLNYALSKNWSLQADAFLYSGTGQKYLGYYYGQYGTKKITLKYSTIDFSIKYSHALKGFFPGYSSVNFIAGNYISVLHNVSQLEITDISNIVSQYKKYDFGIRLGTEFETQLTDHLSLAPGLFVSLGIPNIYKGTVSIPGYLRKTRNGSEGIRITIYYH